MNREQKTKTNNFVSRNITLLAACVAFALTALIFCLYYKITFEILIHSFLRSLIIKCGGNFCCPLRPLIPSNIFTYFIIFFSLCFLKMSGVDVSRRIFGISLFIIILVMAIHTIYPIYVFCNREIYAIKYSTEQKLPLLFPRTFPFAQEAKKYLPSECQADLVTDLDLTTHTGMTRERALAYHFYPVDLRIHPPRRRANCLIFFGKRNAEKYVPKNYHVAYKMNDENLVAVRSLP